MTINTLQDGLTTIERVREGYSNTYHLSNEITKLKMKCWLNHSESRHKNSNKPFTFLNYISHIRIRDILDHIKLDMIDCEDLGGKEYCISFLKKRMGLED